MTSLPQLKLHLFRVLVNFLTAGNLIAIGGYKMPGVWGQGAEPLAGSRGSAPGSYTFFTK